MSDRRLHLERDEVNTLCGALVGDVQIAALVDVTCEPCLEVACGVGVEAERRLKILRNTVKE